MTRDELAAKVASRLSLWVDYIKYENILPSKRLVEDLGMEPQQFMNLLNKLEQEFKVKFSDEEMSTVLNKDVTLLKLADLLLTKNVEF